MSFNSKNYRSSVFSGLNVILSYNISTNVTICIVLLPLRDLAKLEMYLFKTKLY